MLIADTVVLLTSDIVASLYLCDISRLKYFRSIRLSYPMVMMFHGISGSGIDSMGLVPPEHRNSTSGLVVLLLLRCWAPHGAHNNKNN